ncbi:MAG: hypothetical protein KDB79_01740, partial [Acidobacteria bacterium]|nr:hypothetical protein [Acidobacteriota bacterium]
MFCPKCGKADQESDTFCRQCGVYLPDIDSLAKKQTTPEDHLKANTVMTFLTGIVSITLAIILYAMFLGKENTPVIIYIVAGFLTAMFAWQVQVFIRNLMLKKQLKEKRVIRDKGENDQNVIQPKPAN